MAFVDYRRYIITKNGRDLTHVYTTRPLTADKIKTLLILHYGTRYDDNINVFRENQRGTAFDDFSSR